jgi:hypothetical protein
MKERGFTIIETSLFLAISASLILLVLGLWNMVARQRFQDTMVTLRSTVQVEYEEVRTSINERLGTSQVEGCYDDGIIGSGQDRTGNSKCLAVGKLIQFTTNSQDIKINYVVSIDGTNSQHLDKSDEEALKSMQLRLVGDNGSNYNIKSSDAAILPKTVRIEWGGEFAKGWTIPSTGSPVSTNTIAILHSPISGAILVFTFKGNVNPVSSSGALSLSSSSVSQPIAIMIKNGQVGFKGAALCIDSGSSSTAVRMAIPADNFYDFNTNVATYTPDAAKLRSLCST